MLARLVLAYLLQPTQYLLRMFRPGVSVTMLPA